MYFSANGLTIGSRVGPPAQADPTDKRIRMQFVRASADVTLEGEAPRTDVVNEFRGEDPRRWRSGLRTYGRLRYRNVQPGIDVVFYLNGPQLEYDVIVRPGGDLSQLRLKVGGAELKVDAVERTVRMLTGDGVVVQTTPRSFEGGSRRSVSVRPKIESSSVLSFVASAYDARETLVVDPVLDFSRLVQSDGAVSYFGATQDSEGNLVAVGATAATGYPLADPLDSTFNGAIDVVISQFRRSDGELIFSTYFGGSSREIASEVAVDSSGHIYVAGITFSNDFPLLNSVQAGVAGETDLFLVKVSPGGNQLLFSTVFGGTDGDTPKALAVDDSGRAVCGGFTDSFDFPLENSLESYPGFQAQFLVGFDTVQPALDYSTLFGTTTGFELTDVISSKDGNLVVVGTNFLATPDTVSLGGAPAGGFDAFIAKFDSDTGHPIWKGHIEGSGEETGEAVYETEAGFVFAGTTRSGDFPATVDAFQSALDGESDGFVAVVSHDGQRLDYATYFVGADANAAPRYIAVDAVGAVWIAGKTNSTDFPVTPDALQTELRDQGLSLGDLFLMRVVLTGPFAGVDYATYFGGNGQDNPVAMTLDTETASIWLAGTSVSGNFPGSGENGPKRDITRGFLSHVLVESVGIKSASFKTNSERLTVKLSKSVAGTLGIIVNGQILGDSVTIQRAGKKLIVDATASDLGLRLDGADNVVVTVDGAPSRIVRVKTR